MGNELTTSKRLFWAGIRNGAGHVSQNKRLFWAGIRYGAGHVLPKQF